MKSLWISRVINLKNGKKHKITTPLIYHNIYRSSRWWTLTEYWFSLHSWRFYYNFYAKQQHKIMCKEYIILISMPVHRKLCVIVRWLWRSFTFRTPRRSVAFGFCIYHITHVQRKYSTTIYSNETTQHKYKYMRVRLSSTCALLLWAAGKGK